MRIVFDEDACMGYANCVAQAPDLFDLDEDTDKAIVLWDEPDESRRGEVEAAVRACPAAALRLEG